MSGRKFQTNIFISTKYNNGQNKIKIIEFPFTNRMSCQWVLNETNYYDQH